jgi:DNA-binding transcriptional ArsR family regulator
MIETFAALAEPNRLRIVELLRAGPQAVGDISGSLRLNQPQVSKHLRVLKDAGLVDVQPVAQQRLYHLQPASFRALQAWLEDYRSLWDARFTELDGVLADLKKNQKKK